LLFAHLALHGVSEIGEEEAQLFLEPLVNSIIYNEKYDAPARRTSYIPRS